MPPLPIATCHALETMPSYAERVIDLICFGVEKLLRRRRPFQQQLATGSLWVVGRKFYFPTFEL